MEQKWEKDPNRRLETTHYNSYSHNAGTCEVVTREDLNFTNWRSSFQFLTVCALRSQEQLANPNPGPVPEGLRVWGSCNCQTTSQKQTNSNESEAVGQNPKFAEVSFVAACSPCLSTGNKSFESFGYLHVTTHLSLSDPSLAGSSRKRTLHVLHFSGLHNSPLTSS